MQPCFCLPNCFCCCMWLSFAHIKKNTMRYASINAGNVWMHHISRKRDIKAVRMSFVLSFCDSYEVFSKNVSQYAA